MTIDRIVFFRELKYVNLPKGINLEYLLEVISGKQGSFYYFSQLFYESCITSNTELAKWRLLLLRLHSIYTSCQFGGLSQNIHTFLIFINPYIVAVNEFTDARNQEELLNEAYQIINN